MRYFLYVEVLGRKKCVEVCKDEFFDFMNFLEDDLALNENPDPGRVYYFARREKYAEEFVKVGFISITRAYDANEIYHVG